MEVMLPSHDQIVDAAYLAREVHNESRFAFIPFELEKAVRSGASCLQPANRFIRVAVEGSQVVGVVMAKLESFLFSRVEYVEEMLFIVSPGKRGSGAANAMLKALHTWAAEKGANAVFMGVSSGIEQTRVGRYLELNGYRLVGDIFVKEVI